MNLSPKDAHLFFKLMWETQFYINNQFDIVPNVKSAEAYSKLSQEQKVQVRQALYDNIHLLDTFVAENPAGLTGDELNIVQSWKRFVAGKFYILKFLKKHTIFVAADDSDQVYGVLGLFDSLKDGFHGHPLPILVEAVLLPFKGNIIYDGLFSIYSIFFGSGIRGSVTEAYQRAKQNQRIIDTLDPKVAATRKQKSKKEVPDWRPLLADVVKTTGKLHQAETVVQGKAYNVLKASAKLAHASAHNPNNLDELYKLAQKTDRALNQLWTALDRAE